MSLLESLGKVQIFTGLERDEVERVAALCQQRAFRKGDIIVREGETSQELFVIGEGMVEISLTTPAASTPLINLGKGQVFGEMTLVDRGARSATVTVLNDDTVLLAIPHDAFLELCESDNHIGFIVMRNLAAEMSLRLRYHNIAGAMFASE